MIHFFTSIFKNFRKLNVFLIIVQLILLPGSVFLYVQIHKGEEWWHGLIALTSILFLFLGSASILGSLI
jgi:predicted membrane channel-forming protein YqfA (hemolysin III family)